MKRTFKKIFASILTIALISSVSTFIPAMAEETTGLNDGVELSAILVDGVAIEGFDADTTEYNVSLTDAQIASATPPVVTYELMDESSTVVVTQPKAFPGCVSIEVTNTAGESNTYTVNYSVGDMITDLAGLKTDGTYTGRGPLYQKAGIAVDKIASRNDANTLKEADWKITNISVPSLQGQDSIIGFFGFRKAYGLKVEFTLKRAATIKAMTTVEVPDFIEDNFTSDANTDSKITVQNNEETAEYKYLYSKDFVAGKHTMPYNKKESVIIDPSTLYAVEYLPWESRVKLSAILVDGVAIEGFDADTTEYNVSLTDAQIASATPPVVTYELMDESSTVVVTQPKAFPGCVSIEVTNTAGESNTYTVNYSVGDMITDLAGLKTDGTYTGRGPLYQKAGIAVDKIASRNDANTLKEADWKITNISVPSLQGQDSIIGFFGFRKAYGLKVEFTLKRAATIKAMTTVEVPDFIEDNFTSDANTDSKITVQNNEETAEYKYLYSKDFVAGKHTMPYNKKESVIIDPSTLYAVEYLPWITMEIDSAENAGENVKVTVKVEFDKNSGAIHDTMQLLVAGYNGSIMTGADIIQVNKTIASDDYDAILPADTTAVRAFLWKDLSTLVPILPATTAFPVG